MTTLKIESAYIDKLRHFDVADSMQSLLQDFFVAGDIVRKGSWWNYLIYTSQK